MIMTSVPLLAAPAAGLGGGRPPALVPVPVSALPRALGAGRFQAQAVGGDFVGQFGRRIAHGDRVQAVFFEQGDQAAPVDLAAAGRQRGDVDHGQVVFEEVGGAAGHFSQGGVESDAVGRGQDGGDGDDGGNLDFDGLLKQALGHGRQYQVRACTSILL
jgi:hypothetical protein